jgi:metal transporter CNNM
MLFNFIVVLILVIFSGTYAGLTLALFGIKLSTLEQKIRLGNKQAKKVYEIRKDGNLLLCTLLLGNVVSYTVMAIFLGSITSGILASIIATSLIFIFGEILPQAVFPRHALKIGSGLYWLVLISIVLFYPLAAPIAFILDKLLGKEPPLLWSKQELGEIIKYHKEVGNGIIDKDEERIILGALSFSELTISEIMIPLKNVFYKPPDTIINQKVIKEIKEKGFSRIPVYNVEKHTIKGILYMKDLVGFSSEKQITIGNLCKDNNMIIVNEATNLDNLLNLMVFRKMHMALVVNESNQFIGVATMEDIMEEILKMELDDKK